MPASRGALNGSVRTAAVASPPLPRGRDAGGKKGEASEVRGGRITYWIESGVATVEDVDLELPAMKGGGTPKDLFNINGGKANKKKED